MLVDISWCVRVFVRHMNGDGHSDDDVAMTVGDDACNLFWKMSL